MSDSSTKDTALAALIDKATDGKHTKFYPSIRALASRRPMMYTLVSAALLRIALFAFTDSSRILGNRVEIVTPVTSYNGLAEGLFLFENQVPPYDGGIMHQSPLLLGIFTLLTSASSTPSFAVIILYIIADLISGLLIADICSAKNILYSTKAHLPNETATRPWIACALFLFNPYSIMTSVALSTTTLNNTLIIASVSAAFRNRVDLSMLAIAIAANFSMYPAFLLIPLIMILKTPTRTSVILFLIDTIALQGLCYSIAGSWNYLKATYGVLLLVPDLTPNVGLFWYFFIETFDAFRSFFLVVFQLHLAIYVAPMSIKLKNHPLFALFMLCGVIAVFKPYTSVGDTALYLAFLPMYSEIMNYMRYNFLTANLFIYASCLGPVFYHLWIYAGSGNANFFYAITLVFAVGQGVLLGDAMFALLRRDVETTLSSADRKKHVVLIA